MRSDDRGVSEVLGYVLVFSLVVASVGLVSTVGLDQIDDVRETEQVNNAEKAVDLLATNLADIASRGAPSRSTEMQLESGQLDVANPVTVSFRGIDADDPIANNFSENFEVWPVSFTSPGTDRAVVYEAGAVLRTNGEAGTMVRNPSVVAADDRVQVPLVQTRSRAAQSRGGGTARVRVEHARSELLVSDAESTYETFFLNVTSPRASIWVDRLTEYDSLSCSLDESGPTDRAVCEVDEPDRLHVTIVQVDVALEN